MTLTTNDLKKGCRVVLANGWYATIIDNKKGDIRLADVEGFEREMGSVYSHDIMTYVSGLPDLQGPIEIEHTPKQLMLRKQVKEFGL